MQCTVIYRRSPLHFVTLNISRFQLILCTPASMLFNPLWSTSVSRSIGEAREATAGTPRARSINRTAGQWRTDRNSTHFLPYLDKWAHRRSALAMHPCNNVATNSYHEEDPCEWDFGAPPEFKFERIICGWRQALSVFRTRAFIAINWKWPISFSTRIKTRFASP